MKNIGAHINGGLLKAFEMAKKYSFDSAQVMPTAPMRWATKEIEAEKGFPIIIPTENSANDSKIKEKIEQAEKILENNPLKNILLHGVYLTNLARADKQLFHLGKLSLLNYLNYAQTLIDSKSARKLHINILGVCFHPGSAIDLTAEEGLNRIAEGINWVFEESEKSLEFVVNTKKNVKEITKRKEKAKLLIETTAGAGNVLGDSFEELEKMYNKVDKKYRNRVGFVLDTQHTWASGYNWVEDLDEIVKKIEDNLGERNVVAIHLNDSLMKFGSHKDRHANVGEGEIGREAIAKILKHEFFVKNEIPFIMETPSLKDEAGLVKELNSISSILKD